MGKCFAKINCLKAALLTDLNACVKHDNFIQLAVSQILYMTGCTVRPQTDLCHQHTCRACLNENASSLIDLCGGHKVPYGERVIRLPTRELFHEAMLGVVKHELTPQLKKLEAEGSLAPHLKKVLSFSFFPGPSPC
jgi:hypothetical protein